MTGNGCGEGGTGNSTVSFGWLDAAPDGDPSSAATAASSTSFVLGRPGASRWSRPSMTTIESRPIRSRPSHLIAPPSPPQRIGDDILLAWNGSTEQARTTALAMPLLKKASRVVVLDGTGWNGGLGRPAKSLPAILIATVCRQSRSLSSLRAAARGEAILAYAASLQCDLLIKGAYTQSRLRQMIFGGATRHNPCQCVLAFPDGALIERLLRLSAVAHGLDGSRRGTSRRGPASATGDRFRIAPVARLCFTHILGRHRLHNHVPALRVVESPVG